MLNVIFLATLDGRVRKMVMLPGANASCLVEEISLAGDCDAPPASPSPPPNPSTPHIAIQSMKLDAVRVSDFFFFRESDLNQMRAITF